MEFGNSAEATESEGQPLEGVAPKGEASESLPQDSDTDSSELFVDVEGDQQKPKSKMSQEQAYAAWKKEKSKRQERDTTIDELKRKVNDLEQFKVQTSRGPEPTLESCDDDPELFAERYKEWHNNASPAPVPKAKATQAAPQANDAAEFYLYHKEQELSQKLPDYQEAKSRVADVLHAFAPDIAPDVMFQNLSDIARQAEVDISKAIYAMDKVDGLAAELNQAAATRGAFGIADVLRKAEGKVKTRDKKPIDSVPEHDISGSGPVDAVHKEIENARKAYAETGSMKEYKVLQKAKAKLKK